jgi:hypothetical protein
VGAVRNPLGRSRKAERPRQRRGWNPDTTQTFSATGAATLHRRESAKPIKAITSAGKQKPPTVRRGSVGFPDPTLPGTGVAAQVGDLGSGFFAAVGQIVLQPVRGVYQDVIELAEKLAVRGIVPSAHVRAHGIHFAPVILAQINASPFDQLIPSVLADIDAHRIELELPLEILDLRSGAGPENSD